MKLLHIDSSILGAGSVSRALSAEIVATQRRLHPGLEATYRDLAAKPPLHLSPAHIAAWQTKATPEEEGVRQDLADGEAMIAELFAADIIVIGAPMYNFTVPTQLKAWIDRLIIAGRTFRYTANGPESLLPKGKKLIIASSRGGFYGPETPANKQWYWAGTPETPYDPAAAKKLLESIGLADRNGDGLLEDAAGLKMTAVTYRASNLSIQDLIGGTIKLACDLSSKLLAVRHDVLVVGLVEDRAA